MPDLRDLENLKRHLQYDLGIIVKQVKQEVAEVPLEILLSEFTFSELLGGMANIASRRGLHELAERLDTLATHIDTSTRDKPQ